jgi:hypothetical protein
MDKRAVAYFLVGFAIGWAVLEVAKNAMSDAQALVVRPSAEDRLTVLENRVDALTLSLATERERVSRLSMLVPPLDPPDVCAPPLPLAPDMDADKHNPGPWRPSPCPGPKPKGVPL